MNVCVAMRVRVARVVCGEGWRKQSEESGGTAAELRGIFGIHKYVYFGV